MREFARRALTSSRGVTSGLDRAAATARAASLCGALTPAYGPDPGRAGFPRPRTGSATDVTPAASLEVTDRSPDVAANAGAARETARTAATTLPSDPDLHQSRRLALPDTPTPSTRRQRHNFPPTSTQSPPTLGSAERSTAQRRNPEGPVTPPPSPTWVMVAERDHFRRRVDERRAHVADCVGQHGVM